MKRKLLKASRLCRPSDGLLAAALLIASLLGRGSAAMNLFWALFAARLCALGSANALRAAFARQPSMRYVQGSALLALLLQPVGAGIAWLLARATGLFSLSTPLLVGGLVLNIEHVFYEYLCAAGEGNSALACRGITAALALTGLLLYAPPGGAGFEPLPLLVPLIIAALVALTISLGLGGRLRPRLNVQALKLAPSAMLQFGLYPALCLAISRYTSLDLAAPLPLFAGLALVELCRTPFRRSASEAAPLCLALLVACAVSALLGLVASRLVPALPFDLTSVCAALALAALCGFALYGRLPGRRDEA